MTSEEALARELPPDQHIEQAERYANILTAAMLCANDIKSGFTELDVRVYAMYLHAAEVHLRLADAKRRHVSDVAYRPDYG